MAEQNYDAYIRKYGRPPRERRELDEAAAMRRQEEKNGTSSTGRTERQVADARRAGRQADGFTASEARGKQAAFRDRLVQAAEEQQMLTPQVPGIPDFGGPSLMAAPDLGAYVRPYDDAANSVRTMHGEVTPQIDQRYAALAQLLNQRVAVGVDRGQVATNQVNQALAAASTTANQGWDQAQASLAARGVNDASLQGAADQEQQAAIAQIASQYAAQQSLMQNTAAANNESNTARVSEADMAKAAAIANADTNMQAALAKIGVGRADAESRYAADSASVQQQNARLAQEYAQNQWQMAMDFQAATREDAAKRQQMYSQSMMDGKTALAQKAPELQAQNPRAFQGLNAVIGSADNLMTAIQILNDDDPALGMANLTGQEKSQIAEWLKMYYADGAPYYDHGRTKQAFADAGY